MKKRNVILSLMLGLTTAMVLTGCGGDSTPESDPPKPVDPFVPIANDSGLPALTSFYDEPSVEIHYQRNKGSYKDWGLWIWAEGKDGAEYKFNYSDDYGVIAYYKMADFGNPKSLGFIVKKLFEVAGDGVWEKDYQSDRFMDSDMLQIDQNNVYHVYLRSGTGSVYTDKERTKVMNAVKTCQFETKSKILVETNNKPEALTLKCNGEVIVPRKDTPENSGTKHTLYLTDEIDISKSYSLDVDFGGGIKCTKNISVRKLYTKEFDEEFFCDGELGAIYTKEKTTFKVWSPVSSSIKLRIYNKGTPKSLDSTLGDDTYDEYDMSKGEKGVFSYELSGDLEGKYYTYFVTNGYYPQGREVVDPYAKSCGVNGLRGMIVDFSKTNPEGWDGVNYLQYDRKELTVYETHIAELTCSDTWGGNSEKAKKYEGFFQEGTTYTSGDKTVTTGFDHIKELGVNAVQIIPIFDQANDELNPEFNWGYNPLNYNCLEGVYSSNPHDGYARIKEFKNLVKAYNEEGITIIMDVVYNHVNGLSGCNFDVLMPFYYFRYTETGGASNGSGCGNETASDKLMFRKFMIDSIDFWTKEYKLGGYRFDLMGIHDIETMNQLVASAKKINPYVCIYGEPWAGGTTALPAGSVAAVQANANQYVGYGQFNDKMRDAMIKSGMSTVGNKGWVTQDAYAPDPGDILYGIKGNTVGCTDDPNKTVSYATCHDNYTLHDRAIVAGISDEAKIEKMNQLANSVVFTSQGTTFMLAGEELLRTKVVYDTNGNPVEAKDETTGKPLGRPEVSGNSYSSSYKTNEIDYSRKISHESLFENYKKLIQFKQDTAELHFDKNNLNKVTTTIYDNKTCIFVNLNNAYHVYHLQGASKGRTINLIGYEIVYDSLGKTGDGNSIALEAYESLILKKAA